jgi:hypothetical protein
MKEISIEELKRSVDEWVKLAVRREPIIITDGGAASRRRVEI